MQDNSQYLHLHIGATARVEIDGAVFSKEQPITRTLLFDALQQKSEYNREMLIIPYLRTLAEITPEEIERIKSLAGANDDEVAAWLKNKCFPPIVTARLLKDFDLFDLIPARLAIKK